MWYTSDMKTNQLLPALATALVALSLTAGPAVTLDVKPDRAEATYACGETATFTVKVVGTNGVPLTAGRVTTVLDDFGSTVISPTNVVDLSHGNPFTVSGTLKTPGFLRLVLISDIPNFPHTQYCADSWFAAVGFEPEKLRPARPCPDDFNAFWQRGRAEAAAIPLDAQVEKSEKWSDAKWDVWSVSFATVADRRIYGWVAKEKGVTNRLPARVQVAAAGFGGWSQNPMKRPGYVNLFLTVFPFAPGPGAEAAYRKLDAESRSTWGGEYSTAGIGADDPRACFYYPVLLGADRAIDWLAARDDVDPRQFVYDGTSQGGGFGLFCAGLNGHFTKVVCHVPALTDHSAYENGRLSGWPNFVSKQTTPERRAAAARNAAYFDGVNFARNIRIPIYVTCGTSDAACHPHCVWTAYNVIPSADKHILTGFGMPHGEWGEFYAKTANWLKEP